MRYFEAVKNKFSYINGEFKQFAISTNNFSELSIDWNGSDTFIQSASIVHDYGIFPCPDDFFSKHSQHLGKAKSIMYSYVGRRIMNSNVTKIRNGVFRI